MSDTGQPCCNSAFYCRDCGEMWCEHKPCSCFACGCPCHGGETVVHED